ncbi:MAG TPA: hypothetical protein VL400_26965 [Polyangiaceae bacterium]|nr:hypothetical protein [Polyangiaceae bacterium]
MNEGRSGANKTMSLAFMAALGVFAAACGKTPAESQTPAAADGVASSTATVAPSAPKTCEAGHFLYEGECRKECATDADCPQGDVCEDAHVIMEDGSMGPLAGRGCSH